MPEQSSPETAEMDQEPGPPAPAAALASDSAAPEDPPSQLDDFKNRVQLLCDGEKADFDAWVSLLRSSEETSSDDIEVISLVYHRFLLEFPLCFGYWIKYAAHKARLCTNEHVVEVYEQAVQAVPHSVDLWVSYCDFGVCSYEDPAAIRSLFERALSLVGKDYLCYHLWDKYIEFENSQKELVQLATIYINTLKFPTKKLHEYYESFRKLVTLLEQEVSHCIAERLSESIHTSEVVDAENSELDITAVISDLFDPIGGQLRPEALKQYLSVGEHLYQKSSKFYKDICCFEASIKRPFFHFKPLDDAQLGNWHQYLDYVEKNGDFDWAVKLYERCLIPCANYSEFWIRYAEYVDAKGGREIASYALGRASSCFVKGVPAFCMYYAMFKEQIGDASAARALFVKARSNFTSGYYANINRLANMEKRMGNIKAAYDIYETAIEDATQKQNIEILPDLYSNFAQFVYVASRSIREAKEVFDKGIKRAPCKQLIKGLIQFMSMHGGATEIPLLDSVISNAVTPGSDIYTTLSPEDREDISLMFLEFVDLYGGVEELKKAWARHSKLFPQSIRNMSQQYFSTGNSLQENNKRRKTEPMMVAHDHTLEEDIRTLKQSSIPVNYSMIPDKEVDSQGDRNIVDSREGHNDAEEKKSLENVDLHHEASRTAHECSEMVHGPHGPDNFGMQNQMNSHAKEVADQDLGLCKQNGEKTNFHQDQGEEAPVAESAGRDSPSIAIACSEKINSQEKVTEVYPGSHPEILCSKSDSTSGASIPKEGRPSDPHQVSPELEERQPVKVQVEVDMKNDLSVNNANTERFDDGPNKKTQCVHESQDHIQSSQPQQLPVFAKPSSSELAKTEMSTLRCEAQPKQEMYLMQQQQMYQQQQNHQQQQQLLQQQLMQQQYLSQMPQQQQDSVQQQQLFQQQQQQMLLLQQQQQQFIQQQMQQYTQQQQTQQGPKDQSYKLNPQVDRATVSTAVVKEISTDNHDHDHLHDNGHTCRHGHIGKHSGDIAREEQGPGAILLGDGRRNHQMEHGQQSETSQSDGSKRRSGEQSELSYPSTPQSQRSNH
ncbi:hypothetical protein EJB05_49598, partial [Eragrostis curvula]